MMFRKFCPLVSTSIKTLTWLRVTRAATVKTIDPHRCDLRLEGKVTQKTMATEGPRSTWTLVRH